MKIDDKIFVFDDIIDKDYQNKIENLMFGPKCNWFYQYDVTKPIDNVQARPGFSHHFFIKDVGESSEHHQFLLPLIRQSLNKINFKYNNILQGRSFLQLPLNLKDRHIVDTPHIDAIIPHFVVLYYVIDNEANTIIYENKFKGKNYDEIPIKKDLVIKQKVKPKKGRVVMFNGFHWHTAEQPENNVRCIINYNVI